MLSLLVDMDGRTALSGQSEHKVALVTGAARRIGRAIALRLAAEGYGLALHARPRSLAEAEALATEVRNAGGSAQAFAADLSDIAETGALVPQVAEAFGRLDLLANNASVFADDRASAFDASLFDRAMAVNMRAPAILAEAFAKALPPDRHGAIVNIVDQRVWRLNPQFYSYTLSKAALWAATQTMAQTFAPRIRVNAVGPGPVLPNDALHDGAFEKEVAGLPLARAVDVEDIADAVAWLASAKSVTGQMIAVDGGQHIGWRTPDIVE